MDDEAFSRHVQNSPMKRAKRAVSRATRRWFSAISVTRGRARARPATGDPDASQTTTRDVR